jgi:hypothetical protein
MLMLPLLQHGQALIAPCELAHLATHGLLNPKTTTTTSKSWSAPVKVNATAKLENASASQDSTEKDAAALHAQVTAMVMVFAKVSRSLQKTTFHLTYMKILLLNMTVPGMLSTAMAASAMMAFVAQTAA